MEEALTLSTFFLFGWFIDPQRGARLLPADATLPGSGEPPSVWNDDGSTMSQRAWHDSVIRVVDRDFDAGGRCGLASMAGSAVLPSQPGSGLQHNHNV